jgi:hypothetical protein
MGKVVTHPSNECDQRTSAITVNERDAITQVFVFTYLTGEFLIFFALE